MQADSNSLSPYLPLIFIPLIFIFAGFLSSLCSGWSALSRRFRCDSKPCGETRKAGSFFDRIYLRFWTNYSGIIRFTAAEDALYFSATFPFRLSHPPLRIPWEEIAFSWEKPFWNDYVLLTLGNTERIPMRISEGLANKLQFQVHFPGEKLSPDPNFDTLPEDFVESQSKKWYGKS